MCASHARHTVPTVAITIIVNLKFCEIEKLGLSAVTDDRPRGSIIIAITARTHIGLRQGRWVSDHSDAGFVQNSTEQCRIISNQSDVHLKYISFAKFVVNQ